MSQQIIFFEKSKCDYSDSNVTATADQGNATADKVLNRSNNSAWLTSGSVDSDDPYLEIDMVNERDMTDILLIGHNFKEYTLQRWNGSSYVDFSTPINETSNTKETTHHTFDQVSSSKIKLIVGATMTADDDKILRQLIITEQIGQLAGWPTIDPTLSRNKKASKALSGKYSIKENIGARKEKLKVKVLNSDADLTIIENLYYANVGFLYWPCGGDEDQFDSARIGYRLEDIYLMKTSDEWKPKYFRGMYNRGMVIDIDLQECVD